MVRLLTRAVMSSRAIGAGASHVPMAKRGQRRQPRAEEDRELERVCPCVEWYGRSWDTGLCPVEASRHVPTAHASRRQGLATRENLARI